MRNTFSVWACLLIFCVSLTAADDKKSDKAKISKTAKKEVLVNIPGRTLDVEVSKELLKINLSGDAQLLDWILFQPKGEVISRISSQSNIDAIDISTLDKGTYVLMVKDEEGRILHQTFNRV